MQTYNHNYFENTFQRIQPVWTLNRNKENVGTSDLTIVDAGIEDIPVIMEIQESQIKAPETLSPDEAQKGFLVYKIDADELKTLMTGNIRHLIKIARKNGKAIGYFIAYDMQYYLRQHPDWMENFVEENPGLKYKEIFSGDDVLFSKQLALSDEGKKSGIGFKLFDAVLADAILMAFKHEVGEVLAEPIRNISMEKLVFGKLKFKLAGYQTDKNNRKWSVITRQLPPRF